MLAIMAGVGVPVALLADIGRWDSAGEHWCIGDPKLTSASTCKPGRLPRSRGGPSRVAMSPFAAMGLGTWEALRAYSRHKQTLCPARASRE